MRRRLREGERERQCDQIGQFIALWATFSKPVATIILPNYPHF